MSIRSISFVFLISIFSVLCVLPAYSQRVGDQILTNPDFRAGEDGFEGWKVTIAKEYRDHPDAQRPTVVSKSGQLPFVFAKIPNKSAAGYISISQPVELIKWKTYRLKGEARLAGEGKISMSLRNNTEKKGAGFGVAILPGPAWTPFEYLGTPTRFEPSDNLSFAVGFAAAEGTPGLRNLSLTLTDEPPVKKGAGRGLDDDFAGEVEGITAADLLAEFRADADAAKAKYAEPLALNGPVTSVSKGPGDGVYIFELEFGAVKLAGLGSELGADNMRALASKLKEGKARLAGMQQSPKWASFGTEEKAGHARSCFPTLHATATITGLKGKSIECGRSSNLSLQ